MLIPIENINLEKFVFDEDYDRETRQITWFTKDRYVDN